MKVTGTKCPDSNIVTRPDGKVVVEKAWKKLLAKKPVCSRYYDPKKTRVKGGKRSASCPNRPI